MKIYILYNHKHEIVEIALSEPDVWSRYLNTYYANPVKDYFACLKKGYYILTKEL